MDTWKNASVLQEKAMSIKFLVLGGGGGILGFGGGGGSADFIFYGCADFSDFCSTQRVSKQTGYQNAKFFEFWKLDVLVSVCFGTRLGASELGPCPSIFPGELTRKLKLSGLFSGSLSGEAQQKLNWKRTQVPWSPLSQTEVWSECLVLALILSEIRSRTVGLWGSIWVIVSAMVLATPTSFHLSRTCPYWSSK